MSEQNVAVIPQRQGAPGHVRTKCSSNTPKTRRVGACQNKMQPFCPKTGASGRVRTKCGCDTPKTRSVGAKQSKM